MKKNILLIGPYPPPFGGISIHITRLSNHLKNDYNFSFIDESRTKKKFVFNLRTLNIFKYLSLIIKSDIVHIHSGSSILRDFHIIISKVLFKNIIVTIHSNNPIQNKIINIIDKRIITLSNKIIFVNENIVEKLNYKKPHIIKEAFLPPNMCNEQKLPSFINKWINRIKKNDSLLLVSNAWRLDLYNGKDLYGLNQGIELINELLKQGKNAYLIFNIPNVEENDKLYYNYKNSIEKLDLTNNILLINENISFVKLIEKSDIVLRLTLIDGDAITIREALYMKKPIIASDVVPRPEGTILYKTNNIDDLVKVCLNFLNNFDNYIIKSNTVLNDYLNFYKSIYK